ncbi:MAG: ATP synthase F1 subunit delta [Phycisphaerae bacterium]|jgi:F-type H+-transporting ATPase subunit delta|nr:ATP synthase F1 subunit delta [Phycisphaerae bacterium]
MKQQIDDIARVYAESLFQLADKAGGLALVQTIGAEFVALADAVTADRRFAEFLKTPVIDRKTREEALKRALTSAVSDLLLRFILVVNRKGRSGSLRSIALAYDSLLQEKLGKVEVDVWTAGPLGEDARRVIQQRVSAAIGKDAVLHAYVDPAMIGGIKLRIGDRLVDGSVASKLRSLRSTILETGGADVRGRFQQFLNNS